MRIVSGTILCLLTLASPAMAQQAHPDNPDAVITITAGELQALLDSAAANARARGALAKVNSQLAPPPPPPEEKK